ncbi:hypothetical protein ABZW03_11000 [Kitasatospora sp. NPDC004799]|uniref:hypothetical protein n=1 Tax=Kitasatospora sp. NPDC004799 TaxID=3154460 RepID=UPI0033AE0432
MIRQLRAGLPWLFRAAGAALLYLAVLDGLPAPTLLGCVIGFLVGQEPLSDLWFLLTHRLCGGRLHSASYGRGRRLWSGAIAGVPVELGALPTSGFLLPWGQLPVRAPRLRLWLGSVGLFGLHAGLGAWLATSTDGLPRGIGLGLCFSFVMAAVVTAPRQVNSLWAVFVLPFRPGAVPPDVESPSAVEAERLLLRGRIPEAHRMLDEGRPLALTPAAVALAEGRHEDAERLTDQAFQQGHTPENSSVAFLAAMTLVGRADAGEYSPAQAAARLEPYLSQLGVHDPALARDFLPAADLARLRNDPRTAVRAARRLSNAVGSRFRRSLACCSLAAALIAAGRPEQARKALARARGECPGLARIADLERLLEPTSVEVAR